MIAGATAKPISLLGARPTRLPARDSAYGGRNSASRFPRPLHQRSDKRHLIRAASTPSKDNKSGPQVGDMDVSNVVVNPEFRSSPAFEEAKNAFQDGKVRVLFVSESGVCRAVLAQALFQKALVAEGLDGLVEAGAKGIQKYNVGEGPEEVVFEVAKELGVTVPRDFKVEAFDDARDIVNYDVIFVFDKYTLTDVLREVTVYDTIDGRSNYAQRVRRITDFTEHIEEIDDALYANLTQEEDKTKVTAVAHLISECTTALAKYLHEVHDSIKESEGDGFKKTLHSNIVSMEELDWNVPPLLGASRVLEDSAYD